MDVRPLPAPIAKALEEAMDRLQVPGAAGGIVVDGTAFVSAFGITSVEDPLPVTPETLFQIGSTSKTFTATLARQLADDGQLDIEASVRKYLPGFRLASEEDAAALTVRQLLSHHGGWQGDYFRDTGRGDDALECIVAKMANSPQIVPVGTAFSYNNAGFYVLGRIIEVLLERPFETVVRERIFEPLGMEMSFYFPEEAMIHRFAAGHLLSADGPKVARPWNVPRSIAPGGGVISNVPDQLAYALFHLSRSSSAAPPLPPPSIAAMQQPLAAAGSMCDEIGWSWMLSTAGDERLVMHGGATNGHLSAFELIPSRGYGATLLTNSFTGRDLRPVFVESARKHFLGIESTIAGGPGPQPPLDEYCGAYAYRLSDLEVSRSAGGLQLTDKPVERPGQVAPAVPQEPVELVFIAPNRAAVTTGGRRGETCEFLRDPSGNIVFIRWDGRLAPRIRG